jgi:hypothetical protein
MHCCNNGNQGPCWNIVTTMVTNPLSEHTCNNGNKGHCWETLLQEQGWLTTITSNNNIATMTLPLIPLLHLLFLSSMSDISPQFLWAVVINGETCWHHRLWCGMKNSFRISMYSKEYVSNLVYLFIYLLNYFFMHIFTYLFHSNFYVLLIYIFIYKFTYTYMYNAIFWCEIQFKIYISSK